jgi:hypothetical protein
MFPGCLGRARRGRGRVCRGGRNRLWVWLSHRRRVQMGPDPPRPTAEVVTPCRPEGQVRVQGSSGEPAPDMGRKGSPVTSAESPAPWRPPDRDERPSPHPDRIVTRRRQVVDGGELVRAGSAVRGVRPESRKCRLSRQRERDLPVDRWWPNVDRPRRGLVAGSGGESTPGHPIQLAPRSPAHHGRDWPCVAARRILS